MIYLGEYGPDLMEIFAHRITQENARILDWHPAFLVETYEVGEPDSTIFYAALLVHVGAGAAMVRELTAPLGWRWLANTSDTHEAGEPGSSISYAALLVSPGARAATIFKLTAPLP